ncbi:MAG: MFS transporter [Candidatus Obscuribacterales bacterium]|nr:MFS transporter [Candidatus Obscuribacterales bacterium]
MTESLDMEKVTTAPKGEIFAWAMYDFANSAFTTVVATALFNPYFVKVVAGDEAGLQPGQGTFLLTTSICMASLAVVLTAPMIGTIGDALACKKKLLLVSTIVCVIGTAMLSQVGPGAYVAGIAFLVMSNFAFGTGENLIAAFLPELAGKEDMGKVSAFGWAVGYIGGLSTLAVCLWYISYARGLGQTAQDFIPVTMLITATAYLIGAIPTFLFVKERARPDPSVAGRGIGFAEVGLFFSTGFKRLGETIQHARRYQDLFRFLITLLIYSCGTSTVVSLASVYSQEAMGFTETDSVKLIFVVNITAALGAFGIGFIQDKLGSVRTLAIALCMWSVATVSAYFCTSVNLFWVIANVIGLAMGASGSAGRALVGLFSPQGRSGEFFGLWGFAGKMAAAIGPLSFGLVNLATGGNCRLALLSTTIFFIAGLALLLTVNEKRGHEAAVLTAVVDEVTQ